MRILALVAHPDDAELAAGGTLLRAVAGGHQVTVAVVVISEVGDGMARRRSAAQRAADIGGWSLVWSRFEHLLQVDQIADHALVAEVDRLVEEAEPDVVLSHWVGDSHSDHRRVAQAVISSSRRWDASIYAFRPGELRAVSQLGFSPTMLVDTTPFQETKLAAISQYHYQDQRFQALDGGDVSTTDRYYGSLRRTSFAEPFIVVRQFESATLLA